MISKATINRFDFSTHAIAAMESAGMDDADVWRDVCAVLDCPTGTVDGFNALLSQCLDGADADTVAAWWSYAESVESSVDGEGEVLRPLCTMAEQDRYNVELSDVVGLDVPPWADVSTIGAAVEIARHGAGACAAVCCFYGEALATLTEYGDDVVTYLNDSGCVDTINLEPSAQSWCGFASHVLTIAVELWSAQFDDLNNRRGWFVVARQAVNSCPLIRGAK